MPITLNCVLYRQRTEQGKYRQQQPPPTGGKPRQQESYGVNQIPNSHCSALADGLNLADRDSCHDRRPFEKSKPGRLCLNEQFHSINGDSRINVFVVDVRKPFRPEKPVLPPDIFSGSRCRALR